MGNMVCPAEDAALLASVARDICPFPHYNPSPHFINMLSINSSHHLRNHYEAVQTSLTPEQLEEFSRSLRTTFGREGRVTLGGVGVVALSLAILFDTLAKQVKGEFVPETGPIPNLFIRNPGGYYPPNVFTASNYLRLVPYIANNRQRMREETERYLKLGKDDEEKNEAFKKYNSEDITAVNAAVVQLIKEHVRNHLVRITNATYLAEMAVHIGRNKAITERITESAVTQEKATQTAAETAPAGKSRKKRIPPPDRHTTFSLNCDPEAASKTFLSEVLKANDTSEAYHRCRGYSGSSRTLLHYTAGLVWMDFINSEAFDFKRNEDTLRAQREDFDVRANSLIKWKE